MREGDRIGDRFRLLRRQPGRSSANAQPSEVWLAHDELISRDVVLKRIDESATWDTLGYAHHQKGNHQQAIESYQQALELLTDLVQLDDLAQVLDHLGDAHQTAGDETAARENWQRSLEILQQLGQSSDAVRAKLRHRDPPSAA
jgi:tetratricopeptide (TPR) repeat protein